LLSTDWFQDLIWMWHHNQSKIY